jgi:hypothetical protein
MERICIYPKDIQRVTGKSERYGRKLIQDIKKKYSKEAHQLVTVEEFCEHLGLQLEKVVKMLPN